MGKPKDGWRDTADSFWTWNWKAAARKRRGWRKAIKEAMAQTTD
jgi:hypothetical protein